MAFLLDDIILAPIKGIKWIAEKINEQAVGELTDRSKIQEKLIELQMRFEMDEISEEEFKKKEAVLMEQLNAIEEFEKNR